MCTRVATGTALDVGVFHKMYCEGDGDGETLPCGTMIDELSELDTSFKRFKSGCRYKKTAFAQWMVKKLEEFQLACKKMPKELRAWDAYIELKKTVDDFLESLPLVEQLANPSLRPRHWKSLEDLTNKTLNVGSDTFKLSTLLEAGILDIADDVEEIASSAVKELAIEGKLNDIDNDWVVRVLTFGPFKQRGNIVLNTGATAEMMEVLEESQMGLGSMLASRFVVPFKEFADEWVDKLSLIHI